jgi:hypothetical protein
MVRWEAPVDKPHVGLDAAMLVRLVKCSNRSFSQGIGERGTKHGKGEREAQSMNGKFGSVQPKHCSLVLWSTEAWM